MERQRIRRDRRADVHGRHPDDHRRPARADRVDDLERRRLAADRVERVVHAAPLRQLPRALDHVVVFAVQGVGRAELLRELELVVEEVAGEDHPGAGEPRALDHVEPDAAAADHEHRRAHLHVGRAGHRAHARRHRAAQERRLGPRHLRADRDRHLGRAHDPLGEGAEARELVDLLPVPAQALGAVEHPPAGGLVAVAQDRAAGRAVEAAAALRAEGEDDVIARLDVGDPRTRLFDDARPLVAEHHRERQRPVAVDDVPVAVADAGRLHPHADLAGLGTLLVDLRDLEWLLGRVADRSLHGSLRVVTNGRAPVTG